MIKLALKHFILETCINTLFDNIQYNFKNKRLMVGDKFSILRCFRGKALSEFHDITVVKDYGNGNISINFKSMYQGTINSIDINLNNQKYRQGSSDNIINCKEVTYNNIMYYLYMKRMYECTNAFSYINQSNIIYYKV